MIAPTDRDASVRRRYLTAGLVLETTWNNGNGLLVVTDALALGRHDQRLRCEAFPAIYAPQQTS